MIRKHRHVIRFMNLENLRIIASNHHNAKEDKKVHSNLVSDSKRFSRSQSLSVGDTLVKISQKLREYLQCRYST